MKCPECGTAVHSHLRNCPGCLLDCGFPNVRAASNAAEVAALERRVSEARVSCDARGCLTLLDAFGLAVLSSKIVMARSLADLHSFLESENRLLVSYHRQVRSGGRMPQDNEWDRGRTAAESTIHPNYHEDIQFACISVDHRGVDAWGEYHIVLKEQLVAQRTTVFEENPFHFTRRHKIAAGQPPPLGYRATWSERNKLAQAKLHPELQSSTKTLEFSGILVRQGTSTGNAEFIEAHIYGPLHRNAVELVTGPKPKNKVDAYLWNKVKRTLKMLGAKVQEIS